MNRSAFPNEALMPRAVTAPKVTATEQCAGFIFDEIAELAVHTERLCQMLITADDRDIGALRGAAAAMSAQMGLLADMGAKIAGGDGVANGDPAEWLLPPAYHAAVKRRSA